jgi:hypothetical protein
VRTRHALKLPKMTKKLRYSAPVAKTSGARHRQQSEGAVRPKYLRVPAACIYAGISRQLLYQWINDGSVKSALVKSSRESRSGMRMVLVDSIDAHIASFAEAEKEGNASV